MNILGIIQAMPWGAVAWLVIGLFLCGFLIPIVPLVARPLNQNQQARKGLRLTTKASLACALAGGAIVTAGAVCELASGMPYFITLGATGPTIEGLPSLELNFQIDQLSAFFLLLISALSLAVTVYSFAYLSYVSRPYNLNLTVKGGPAGAVHTEASRVVVPEAQKVDDEQIIAGSYNLFVLAGLAFVAANNIVFLILAIEVSTLAFAVLVLHKQFEDARSSEHQLSPKIYLMANHIGGVLIAVALLVLAFHHSPDPSFTISDLYYAATISHPDIGVRNLVFLLLLIGFGIKVGIVPFHVWVAIAHPSSPTNTHAMSLGIMIKIAIYGMIRFFFQVLGPPPWWWGMLLLLIAAWTALISVNNALRGRTLKEALADHSVENIGIILAGIGMALLFSATDWHSDAATQAIAGLALVAGLFHLLNHTLFKGLLYLSTGAIEYVTGISEDAARTDKATELRYDTGNVDLDRLGGLIHRWGILAACFLVGSVAIAGLPPFNGFISEWLLLQSLIAGIVHLLVTGGVSAILLPVVIGLFVVVMLLTSAFALTAMAFVKIAGEALLGSLPQWLRPAEKQAPLPSDVVNKAAERRMRVPVRMQAPAFVLAGLCLILGVAPWLILPQLQGITKYLGLSPQAISSPSILSGVEFMAPSTDTARGQPIAIGDYLTWVLPFVIFAVLAVIVLALIINRRTRPTQNYRMPLMWIGGAVYNRIIMRPTTASYTYVVRKLLAQDFMLELVAPLHRSVAARFVLRTTTKGLIGASRRPLTTPIPLYSKAEEISAGKVPDNGNAVVNDRFRQFYNLAIALIRYISERVSAFVQNGDLRYYLLYIFGLFVIVLVVLMVVEVGP